MLQTAMVGWHFRRDFYEFLGTVADRFEIVVVANHSGVYLPRPLDPQVCRSRQAKPGPEGPGF